MSKINAIQAAALKTTVAKTASTKPVTAKPVTAKPASKSTIAIKEKPVKPATTTPVAKSAAKKTAKAAKPVKEKIPKPKMERDSFTIPKAEYAQLYVLKERLAKLGAPAKKSELLRAGIMQLTALSDAALKTALSKVPTIKTGRPKKK
ncbi:MAG TPA: hypothetical protein PLW03_02755 [Methylotenera sp.]|jgi:hypothetical protein|nr:hypothetical protein [Methylotenera sp.]